MSLNNLYLLVYLIGCDINQIFSDHTWSEAAWEYCLAVYVEDDLITRWWGVSLSEHKYRCMIIDDDHSVIK